MCANSSTCHTIIQRVSRLEALAVNKSNGRVLTSVLLPLSVAIFNRLYMLQSVRFCQRVRVSSLTLLSINISTSRSITTSSDMRSNTGGSAALPGLLGFLSLVKQVRYGLSWPRRLISKQTKIIGSATVMIRQHLFAATAICNLLIIILGYRGRYYDQI